MQDHHAAAGPRRAASPVVSPLDPGQFLHALVDVVCVLDGQGIFRYVSAASAQLFGYTPAEMTGVPFLQFIHPDDAEKTLRCMSDRTPGCHTSHFENRYRRKDGSLVPILWSGRWDDTGSMLYCVARDGTAQCAIEQRLNKAQQLARVADYEFDVVNHCYTHASDTIFDIFGIDRKQHPRFTSELFWSRVHPDDLEAVRQSVLCPDHLQSSELEYRIVHPDRGVVYIHRIREIIRDSEGRPLKTIGTLQDITDRKRMELERVRSEERLRSMVEYGSDVIGVLDAEGTYLYVGTNLGTHIGYSVTELQGLSVYSFIHPEDQPLIRQAFEEIRQKKVLQVGPFRYRNPEGEWRWMETTATNHLDNPVVGGIITNSRDVTEKKQKDDERQLFLQHIEEQHHMMEELLEQMPDGFITLTLEGRVIHWNDEAGRLTGIPKEKALGHSLGQLFAGIEQTPAFRMYRQLVDGPGPLQETVYSPFSNRWFELRGYKTRQGISVYFRDVSQRKAAEEELRKLSLIARETTNPVIIQDPHRRVLWVNDAFLNLSGYRLEECTGRFIGDICDGPATDPAILQYVQQQMARSASYRIEVLNYKKNGDTYWSDVSCQPVFNDKGEVVQYFSIATDVTERKRLERQLEHERHERQKKITAATLKAQEHERSEVSRELHDNVNQVLTTVKLYTEMVRDGMGDQTEMLNKSIGLLQDSINEIRSLSKRLSAPSLGRIRLAESVKELIDAVAVTKKFSVRLDTSTITLLEVDQEVHLAVYRVLQEHLTNIIKHAGASRVSVTLEGTNNNILLRVKDNGRGFDPSGKHNGIGLDNMITRAESLNGSLSIRSAPGKGCELVVSIPLS